MESCSCSCSDSKVPKGFFPEGLRFYLEPFGSEELFFFDERVLQCFFVRLMVPLRTSFERKST